MILGGSFGGVHQAVYSGGVTALQRQLNLETRVNHIKVIIEHTTHPLWHNHPTFLCPDSGSCIKLGLAIGEDGSKKESV